MTRVAGLLLAAGAGRRFGGPKALALIDGEPLVSRALRALSDGGCASVHVVLGAQADRVRELLPEDAATVTADDWAEGMGASLRAGLRAVPADADAVLVHLVDLPWIGAPVVRRLLGGEPDRRSLARAAYAGVPGHPVLIGGHWWPELAAAVGGDTGARDWLRGRPELRLVECADIGRGDDVDRPGDLGS
ncbi:nucleotidyltransferase family protein [Pseudonocardiaceae bacterium YIM PH 21723]|nr:nucleotidyltransferase family protein [Pseudonocardiaceae bacterium YIM PH 21723]